MSKPNGRRLSLILVGLILIFTCSSCLERSEEITVAPDGATTIVAKFDGSVEDLAPPISLPKAAPWTVTEPDPASVATDSTLSSLVSEITVPYGQPLPETYAAPGSANETIALKFPSEVRYWREGKRVYYEFRRTYRARQYGCYNIAGTAFWNQDLEQRVLENGIFNVSVEDRREYLNDLGLALGYQHWRFLRDSFGTLAREGRMSLATMQSLEEATYQAGDAMELPERLLDLLGGAEDSLDVALARLEQEIHAELVGACRAQLGAGQQELMALILSEFSRLSTAYELSERIGSQTFSITVRLPGHIIESNGIYDPDQPGEVSWLMKGSNLYDADVPLYVLSVVEER